ncbi:hypothetical protein EDD17DRAFT_1681129 [Pisolithus thermaeus]|nr:hypothetical protein EDD17DRAFT_1681129 [Pisolithus thermaeus]
MYHSEDGLTMKLVVAAIWIFDTLHVSFVCHMLHYYLIVNYGVPTSLEYIIWFACLFASVLVNVRSFYLTSLQGNIELCSSPLCRL